MSSMHYGDNRTERYQIENPLSMKTTPTPVLEGNMYQYGLNRICRPGGYSGNQCINLIKYVGDFNLTRRVG